MRRLAAALVLVLVAGSLAACGGGGAPETTTAPPATPAAPAGGAAAAPAGAAKDTKSPTETVTNEPFPVVKDETPADVTSRLQNGQPMILFFYDDTQQTTDDQRAELDVVLKKYRGLIELLSYDIEEGLPGSAQATSPVVQQAAQMAGTLKVNFTPYIIFVDRAGRITYRFSGFVDRELLEREVLRATG